MPHGSQRSRQPAYSRAATPFTRVCHPDPHSAPRADIALLIQYLYITGKSGVGRVGATQLVRRSRRQGRCGMALPYILRQTLECSLCAADVGYLDTLPTSPPIRRVARSDGAAEPLARHGGVLRCPWCGGSLLGGDTQRIAVWPPVPFGRERPGRKPRRPREAA